jgi:hypothetical protein
VEMVARHVRGIRACPPQLVLVPHSYPPVAQLTGEGH